MFVLKSIISAVIFIPVYCDRISFQKYCSNSSIPWPNPFPISGDECSGSIVMNEEPQNGSWYEQNMNCSVTFSAESNYFLLLTFSNISLRNSSMDNLTVVYNSDKSSMSLSGQQVCSNENCEGLKFDSGVYNNLTLIFYSANASVPPNFTGFRAHYTVYDKVGDNRACKDRKKFLCENGHCISYKLVCDGHNNCGDRTDENKCRISFKDTVWGIVVIVIAIISLAIFVPLFICLATYGTRSIVRSVTLSTPATPLVAATDAGEGSGLLTSSDVFTNCWPGTSYERSNSFSYGTTEPKASTSNEPKKQFRSMSEAVDSQGAKFL